MLALYEDHKAFIDDMYLQADTYVADIRRVMLHMSLQTQQQRLEQEHHHLMWLRQQCEAAYQRTLHTLHAEHAQRLLDHQQKVDCNRQQRAVVQEVVDQLSTPLHMNPACEGSDETTADHRSF